MIRLARIDDLPQLRPLVADYMLSQVELGASDQTHTVEALMRYGISSGEAIVVAEDCGEIVGFCAWSHHDGAATDEVAAVGTYVVPEHRGKRLASQMRAHAKQHCRQRGYKRITAAVLNNNEPGIQSLLKSGFHTYGWLMRFDL